MTTKQAARHGGPGASAAECPRVTALQCMTIATGQPELLGEILQDALGWEPLVEHAISPPLERQWGIAPGSAGARASVYRSAGTSRGMVRVVAGAERPRTRAMATRVAKKHVLFFRRNVK